jgi:protein-disulfide isomerase
MNAHTCHSSFHPIIASVNSTTQDATLKQLLDRYPGKLRLAYRDFPLEAIHPQARRAAEATRCAQDQGKFWDYHDILFTEAPNWLPMV